MRKAYANIIYMAVLILIFMVLGAFMITSIFDRHAGRAEIRINNIVYLMDDSASLAKLYLDDSMRLSLYQSMYDLGRSGLNPDTGNVWFNGGVDSTPDEAQILQAIEDATAEHLAKYTKQYTVTSIFSAEVPFYMNVRIYPNRSYLRAVASASSPVTVKRITQDQQITIQRSSLINLTVNAPFMELYREVKEAAESAKPKLQACNSGEINQNHETFCCTVETAVVSSANGCEVKIEGKTKQFFPVWDGSRSVMEPLPITAVLYS